MALLYHWRGEIYRQDAQRLRPGLELTLEQNSPVMGEAEPGDQLWAFTRREDGRYVLAAALRTGGKPAQAAPLGYGVYPVTAEPGSTVLYDIANGEDVEPVIRGLSIKADAAILGQSFQGAAAVRWLNQTDSASLATFAARQPVWYSTAESIVARHLELWEDYTREQVHAIFAPGSRFTPQAGIWGLQGIVQVPGRPGDFVFFVTFGKREGAHTFDEWITEDGALSWQSQPKQTLRDSQIKQLVGHDELRNSIYLFLRTRDGLPYTFMGRLSYITHDHDRERPVHFQWQLLDWQSQEGLVERIGLKLVKVSAPQGEENKQPEPGIQEVTQPPSRHPRTGTSTPDFRPKKGSVAANAAQRLGLWGALLSTGLGVLRVVEFWRDRARLRVEPIWERGDVSTGRGGEWEYSWAAARPVLRVVNTGRRTVHVMGAGVVRGRLKREQAVMATDVPGLPAVLDEGKSVRLFLGDWIRDPDVRAIVVRDSLGRDWRASRRVLRKFLRTSPPTED
jgi:hypothetical protein